MSLLSSAREKPLAAVLVFPGTNGERDLHEALCLAGFDARYVAAKDALPSAARFVLLPGGFSYGDYWRAGLLASRARAVAELPRIVAARGLVLGICNGFQILLHAGLLPGALTYNEPPRFIHRTVTLRVTSAAKKSASPFFAGTPQDTMLRMPIAHQEGCFFHPGDASEVLSRVPLVYEQNPNGSLGAAAAVLDATGHVLGIMPHPERAIDERLGSTDGLRLFHAAHRYLTSQAAS